jgi:FAD/FMN-containing dehydrogenase
MFVFPDATNQELIHKVTDTYKELFSEVMEKYGAHPYRARFGQTHLYKQTGGYYDILLRIKQAIDPNNILNPHVFSEANNED